MDDVWITQPSTAHLGSAHSSQGTGRPFTPALPVVPCSCSGRASLVPFHRWQNWVRVCVNFSRRSMWFRTRSPLPCASSGLTSPPLCLNGPSLLPAFTASGRCHGGFWGPEFTCLPTVPPQRDGADTELCRRSLASPASPLHKACLEISPHRLWQGTPSLCTTNIYMEQIQSPRELESEQFPR